MSIWYPLLVTALAIFIWVQALLGTTEEAEDGAVFGLLVFCVAIGLWIGWAVT